MNLKKMIARVMRALPHTPPNVIGEQDVIDLLNEAQLNLARLSSKISTEETDLEFQSGVVNVTLKEVEWVSGDKFDTTWTGTIEIDDEVYTIDSVTDSENLVLTESAGTDTGLDYEISIAPDVVALPSDLLKLESVYFDDKELTPGADKVPVEHISYGTPAYYYVFGSDIVLRPKPNLERTLKVGYMATPTELADDADVPDLVGSEEYLIAYTLYRLHLEASSPNFQLWNSARAEALIYFMETSDQNYQTPFRVSPRW